MIQVEVTVIGGGIVGCAIAAAAAGAGRQVVLLEKEGALARGTTARNSEVAHGGMYYPTGSLKARCCVRGRRLMRDFCEQASVPYKAIGKLIVSTAASQEPELERLFELGRANGVEDLSLIDRSDVRRLEPQIEATAALLSPATGIFDAEGAAGAYGRLASEHGAEIMTDAEVTALQRCDGQWHVTVSGRSEEWTHASRLVVNAAGLGADRIAALAGAVSEEHPCRQVRVKGNYFSVAPEHAARVSRLIYPVPPEDDSSLGVHVCLDLGGQIRLGPDVERVEAEGISPMAERVEDYSVDPARSRRFYDGASRFLPWLKPEDLSPAMAGLRPKLALSGFHDFQLWRDEGDCSGLINLIGIDSPGLTSAPALAEEVLKLMAED